MAYFERVDDSTYRATEHVSGAWKVTEQHIAPALGLLAHVVESDRDGRGRDDLVIGRVSYDILGVLPIDTMQTSVRVLRPGRTIELVDDSTYRATEHVSGAWKVTEQLIAPALGLLAHVVESDRDGRGRDDLVIGRVSYDILGVLPIDTMQTSVRVLRPGRTIELVEARLRHDDRDAVILRAWLMRPQDTRALAGTSFPRIPSLDDTPEWNPSSVWGGGFIASLQGRRTQVEPGRATFWLRTPLPLVGDQKVSSLA